MIFVFLHLCKFNVTNSTCFFFCVKSYISRKISPSPNRRLAQGGDLDAPGPQYLCDLLE